MATEKRLIDANALLESIEGIEWYTIRVDGSATLGAPSEEVAWYKATDIYAATENAQTVDAVEVVHGLWVHTDKAAHWYSKDECNICTYHSWDRHGLTHFNYCPNCGAKMDSDVSSDEKREKTTKYDSAQRKERQ